MNRRTDFRSFVRQCVDYKDHWLADFCQVVRETGWTGLSPESLREHLSSLGFSQEMVETVDRVEHFWKLYLKREALS